MRPVPVCICLVALLLGTVLAAPRRPRGADSSSESNESVDSKEVITSSTTQSPEAAENSGGEVKDEDGDNDTPVVTVVKTEPATVPAVETSATINELKKEVTASEQGTVTQPETKSEVKAESTDHNELKKDVTVPENTVGQTEVKPALKTEAAVGTEVKKEATVSEITVTDTEVQPVVKTETTGTEQTRTIAEVAQVANPVVEQTVAVVDVKESAPVATVSEDVAGVKALPVQDSVANATAVVASETVAETVKVEPVKEPEVAQETVAAVPV